MCIEYKFEYQTIRCLCMLHLSVQEDLICYSHAEIVLSAMPAVWEHSVTRGPVSHVIGAAFCESCYDCVCCAIECSMLRTFSVIPPYINCAEHVSCGVQEKASLHQGRRLHQQPPKQLLPRLLMSLSRPKQRKCLDMSRRPCKK